jgi:hypothetical protein
MRIGDLEQLTKFHDKLNPDLWENNRLKPEVRLALFKIAKAFVEFINVSDLQLTDVTMSGSNASYNYNSDSDIDLHLVADVNGPCEADLDQLFMAKKGAFNDQHDINIYGHSVEVYVQRSDEKHISNGIYSVYNDNWIKFPKTIVAKPDTTNIEDKFEHLHAEIEQAIESGDRSTIKRLKERIAKIRKSGLAREGEYGVENLTFKLLRNEGDLDKLNDAHLQAVDNDLSLSEGNAFSGALKTAREKGLEYFIVDGKKYKVKKSMQKIVETWSKKYKKSINCSHPKGFSQKAHCAGRRKRKRGEKTKSKSVS